MQLAVALLPLAFDEDCKRTDRVGVRRKSPNVIPVDTVITIRHASVICGLEKMVPLRDVLTGFADILLATDDPTEGVTIDIVRREGFQNEAVTPLGQQVLIDEPVHFGGQGEAPDLPNICLPPSGRACRLP